MNKIEFVATLNSSIHRACDECDRFNKSPADDVNHYIQEHGYQLLYIGQETDHSSTGELWHSTVYVLGTENGSNAARLAEERRTRDPVKIVFETDDAE